MRPGAEGTKNEADSLYCAADAEGWGAVRTRRILEGKADVVGVAGRTLTEV